MKQLITITALLLSTLSSYAQYGDETYTVNITGAPSITLDYMRNPGEMETHSLDQDNNLGTFYPDTDGVIRIELSKGHYQYFVNWKSGNVQNGSFYISNRNVYFEIRYNPPVFNIDTPKTYSNAYRSLISYKKKKEARELFYIAAEAGHVDAMFDYARMCWNGIGGKKNKNHAYHYINEALEHGHPLAAYYLEHFKDKYVWKWYL